MIHERPHMHAHKKDRLTDDRFLLHGFAFAIVGVALALGLLATVGRVDFFSYDNESATRENHSGPKGDLSAFIPKPFLRGTTWNMTSITVGGKTDDVSKKGFELSFDKKIKSLSFRICNSGTVFFSENGPSFVAIKPIALTRMMCPDAIMNVEKEFVSNIESGMVYTVHNSNLTFSSMDGVQSVFTFTPKI